MRKNSQFAPDKNLGQHWLADRQILSETVDCANVNEGDTILEIGPGPGTLTAEILSRGASAIAVEFDRYLAGNLAKNVTKILQNNYQISPENVVENASERIAKNATKKTTKNRAKNATQIVTENLQIYGEDFLCFDLNKLPSHYKVIANIPYNITAKIIQKILYDKNPPQIAVLLMQKEVAERLVAQPGDMSILAVAAQLRAEISLGLIVPPEKFTPPPKVDSQVAILKLRDQSLFADLDERIFFRVMKAGFSARRKKLRSSLAGGLNISKADVENLLNRASISPDLRAQDLSLNDWSKLSKIIGGVS